MGTCTSCTKSQLQATQIRSLLKKDMSDTTLSIDANEFLNRKCFIVFYKGDGAAEYAYLRMDNTHIVWDSTTKITPVDFITTPNLQMDPKTYDIIAHNGKNHDTTTPWNSYVFSVQELMQRRDWIKLATKTIDVNLGCIYTQDHLQTLMNSAQEKCKKDNYFMCLRTPCQNMELIIKHVGMFGIRNTNGVCELVYIDYASSIEHGIGQDITSGTQNRVVLNNQKQVLIYENDRSDQWMLASDAGSDDILQYITHKVWIGEDKHITVIHNPVMICEETGSVFTSGDALGEQRFNDIDQLSKHNYAAIFDPLIREQHALFKHASSVSLCAISKSSTRTVWSIKNKPIDTAEECVSWARHRFRS